MADYVTAAQVGYFAHEFAALHATGQALLVTAASRLFDRSCEVSNDFFGVPEAFADRDFLGDGTAFLKLDPYTELNAVDPVKINEGTIDDPDYLTDNVPEHIAQNGTLIVLDKTKPLYFDPYYPNRFQGWPQAGQIRVSARWGFAAIPEEVVLAVTHLALHLWRTADPAFATISNAEGAAVRERTIPKIAQEIIDRYRSKYSRRAVFA